MADGEATYNNGLYTPWTTPGQAAAATTPAQVVEPVASTTQAQEATTTPAQQPITTTTTTTTTPPPTTTTPPPTTTTTTTSQTTPPLSSSSTTNAVVSTTDAVDTTSPTTSIETPTSSSTLVLSTSSNLIVLSSTSASLPSSSTSAYMIARPTIVAAPSSKATTSSSFHTTYLIPVFVAIPVGALIALLVLKPRTRRWFTVCGKRRSLNHRSNFANPGDDDADALVARRYRASSTIGGAESEKEFWGDEKRSSGSSGATAVQSGPGARGSGWGGWLVNTLRKGPRSVSGTSFSGTNVGSPFVTVPYANLDDQHNHAGHGRKPSEGMGGGERGWSWGGATEEPTRQSSGRAGAGKDYSALTGGGGSSSGRWHNTGSTRRHRSRSQMKGGAAGAQSSAGSRQLLANIFGAGATQHHPASPSLYSTHIGYDDESVRDRYEPEEEVVVDFDAYLGASRVRDDDLAQRYMNGEEIEELQSDEYASVSTRRHDPSPYDDEAPRYQPGAVKRANDFVVDLPLAPGMVHTSPTKSAIVRPAPPQFSAPPPAQPIFSPQRTSTRPLPPSNPASPTRPPLPQPPRHNSGGSTEYNRSDVFNAPGSAMPAYESELQNSASAYSLAGVVFADDTSTEVGAGAGVAGVGLRSWDNSPREEQRSEIVIPLITTTSASSPARSVPRPLPVPASHANVPRHPAPAPQQSIPRNTSFDPVFPSGPALEPLVHPSRVRQAISTLEARAAAATAPVPPPSPDRPRTPRRSASPRWSNQFEQQQQQQPMRPVSPTLPPTSGPWGGGMGRLAPQPLDRSASVDDDMSIYDDGATDVGDVAALLKNRAMVSRTESMAVRRR